MSEQFFLNHFPNSQYNNVMLLHLKHQSFRPLLQEEPNRLMDSLVHTHTHTYIYIYTYIHTRTDINRKILVHTNA